MSLLLVPLAASPGDLILAARPVHLLIVMAIFCTAVPFFLMSEGIRRAGATYASLLTFVGPPITVAAAWVLLGERMNAVQILGSIVVLAAIAWLRWKPVATSHKAEPPGTSVVATPARSSHRPRERATREERRDET